MVLFLLLGIALAAGLFILLNWWANAEVKSAKRALMWGIIAICIALGGLLYARGGFFSALLPGAVAVWRMTSIARQAASMAGRMGGGRTHKPHGSQGQMTEDQAYEVLGLESGAPEEEINKAYKRLMAQCHPDKGGSDWMAAQLNEAKRVLTK